MLTAIVLLPLLGFVLNGLLATRLGGNRVGPRFVSVVGCGLPIASFVLVVKALLDLRAGGWAPLVETAYRWALIGDSTFEIAFYFDRLSAVMALVVTGVGSVIHVYSIGYMKDDEGYGHDDLDEPQARHDDRMLHDALLMPSRERPATRRAAAAISSAAGTTARSSPVRILSSASANAGSALSRRTTS